MNHHYHQGEPSRPRSVHLSANHGSEPPDPADSPYAVDRLTVLAHELSNLLDGAMRCLRIARSSLPADQAPEPGHGELESARRQLETVHGALERMAGIVDGAMRSGGKSLHAAGTTISLMEAVNHAVDVCRASASDIGIEVALDTSAVLENIPAGPIYPVILNGLTNAIEAIAGRFEQHSSGGRIEISAGLTASGTGVQITITDDGIGLPGDVGRLFEPGLSTKPSGTGIGLAVCREIIAELGGVIELRPSASINGRGAELFICYPLPGASGENWIG